MRESSQKTILTDKKRVRGNLFASRGRAGARAQKAENKTTRRINDARQVLSLLCAEGALTVC